MFFITILATAYAITASLRQSQLKTQLALKQEYEKDIDNVNEIAQKLATTNGSLDLNNPELIELIKQISQQEIQENKLSMYPIGSIYTSTNDISPADLFGGTWEQIQDVFLLAAGSTYTAGSTGGEATHILTRDELPYAAVVDAYSTGPSSMGIAFCSAASSTAYYADIVARVGKYAQPINNMPPYLTVYVWKRIS